jgi:hypothetical protein
LDGIPAPRRFPLRARRPGDTRIPTTCSLVLLSASRTKYLTPGSGVLVLRNLEDAQSISQETLGHMRAVVLCMASSAHQDEQGGITAASLCHWQAEAVQVFAQASARAGLGADGALPLSFSLQDQLQYFVAQATRLQGWSLPFTLMHWDKLLVDAALDPDCYLNLSAESRFVMLESPDALVAPLHWRAAYRACTALGLSTHLSAHNPGFFASLQAHTAVVRPPTPTAVKVRAIVAAVSVAEDRVRQEIQRVYDRESAKSYGLRLALGAQPAPISYEKMVASVHGKTYEGLQALLGEFAGGPQLDFAREQLGKLHAGSADLCAVCMCEPPTVMTFCGHLYCWECAQELKRSQETPAASIANSKCCVCRAPIFSDDWWRLVPAGTPPAFERPALLQALLDVRAAQAAAQGATKPVVVAVPTLADVSMLCGRLAQSLGSGSAELLSSVPHTEHYATLIASKAAFLVCAATDLRASCLVRADIRQLVVLGSCRPCQHSVQPGGAQPYAYASWACVLGPLLLAWGSGQQTQRGGTVDVVILEDSAAPHLALVSQLQKLLGASEAEEAEPAREPARAPRNYNLRSKARARQCTGANLRTDS